MRLFSRLSLFFLTVFAAGFAHAEPLVQRIEEHRNDVGEIEKRTADFVHRSSGFVYPASLAEMPARKTVTYGPADAAVYYTLYGGGNGDPWIDLFVYPVTLAFDAERHEIEKALVEKFKAKVVSKPQGLPSLPLDSAEGWYSGSAEGSGYLTGYRLHRSGGWYIKARVSVPVNGGELAVARAMKGIGAIPWTQPLGPAPSSPQPVSTGAN